MIYIAHVITESDGRGDPEVVVMTGTDEAGTAAPIVSYPLPPGSDPGEVLTEHGWRVCGIAARNPYLIMAVEPTDWIGLIHTVTEARAEARAELERQDTAWCRVVGDAMCVDGVPRQKIARAARISMARAYQIKRGQR